MQINYHFSPTKIQKLQNLKKKKKFYNGRYARYRSKCLKLTNTANIQPV